MWLYLFGALVVCAALVYCIMAVVFTWKYVSYVRSRRQSFLDNPEQVALVRAQRTLKLSAQKGNCTIEQTNQVQSNQVQAVR